MLLKTVKIENNLDYNDRGIIPETIIGPWSGVLCSHQNLIEYLSNKKFTAYEGGKQVINNIILHMPNKKTLKRRAEKSIHQNVNDYLWILKLYPFWIFFPFLNLAMPVKFSKMNINLLWKLYKINNSFFLKNGVWEIIAFTIYSFIHAEWGCQASAMGLALWLLWWGTKQPGCPHSFQ